MFTCNYKHIFIVKPPNIRMQETKFFLGKKQVGEKLKRTSLERYRHVVRLGCSETSGTPREQDIVQGHIYVQKSCR